ncbi:helix-turn-helix domain-containing protein [Luteimicrobium subarcticum]|uniref:XRE family transcriptional regulator n=1 Tax=Luteimicrobium subarcticum TaxID=620910 RepID=A0A2M8WJ25_9MICO|nr:XRE family transcriptional regulator [Luteimicrobium subarcticum]PJI90929.1 XRE family transcriptional regulator [Luteimicrobium subarcticum]
MTDGTTDDVQAVLDRLGPRLRDARTRRGMTLAQVSDATGISTSTLSRLESGGRRATIELLVPLARAYGFALDDLVGAPATGDPRIRPRPVRRHGRVYLPLTPHAEGLQAFKVIIPGTDPDAPVTLGTHAGYEWLYVLSGRVRLCLDGTETVLERGEAAEFDTRTPHAVLSADDQPAEVLNLFGPQGEQVHVRGR